MAKMAKELESESKKPEEVVPRYKVIFLDDVSAVQIAAATDDLDKFTKTDLMKMVKAFKKEVNKQNEKWEKANESRKRGDS